jgi:hypothetical protein
MFLKVLCHTKILLIPEKVQPVSMSFKNTFAIERCRVQYPRDLCQQDGNVSGCISYVVSPNKTVLKRGMQNIAKDTELQVHGTLTWEISE